MPSAYNCVIASPAFPDAFQSERYNVLYYVPTKSYGLLLAKWALQAHILPFDKVSYRKLYLLSACYAA
jgi:hypothetical protein